MSTSLSLADYSESLVSFRSKIRDLSTSHFPVWELERLTEFVTWAVTRLSPLQVGDTAELSVTPEIGDDSGWRGSKHFLVQGHRGIIRSISWNEGLFNYMWEPENQTWISSQNKQEYPSERPYHFLFSETSLKKSDPVPVSV